MISEIYFQRKYHKYEDICKAFSFNVDGGVKLVRKDRLMSSALWLMFTPVKLAHGKRFKKVLGYFNKNIHDILTMTIDDAVAF
jgi:excinuclease ABC subunit A